MTDQVTDEELPVVSISVGVSVGGAQSRGLGADIASPGERRTDDACAAQDSATESLSQGLARHRDVDALGRDGPLDRMIQQPGPLDRLSKTS